MRGMRDRLRTLVLWPCLLRLIAGSATAGDSPRPPAGDPDRILESKTLHRRLDMGGIEVWSQKTATWHPYTPPRGKLLVMNLWAKSCRPCVYEMQELARLAERWQRRNDVEFLLVATSPEEMTRQVTEEFFRRRLFEAKALEPCPGRQHPVIPIASPRPCELDLPPGDPARSRDQRLENALGTSIKPITLLVDPRGIVRHAFVGSIASRGTELLDAVERLAATLAGSR